MASFNKEQKQKFAEEIIKMANANNWENKVFSEVTLLRFIQRQDKQLIALDDKEHNKENIIDTIKENKENIKESIKENIKENKENFIDNKEIKENSN